MQGKEESGITLKNWVSATGRMKFPFAEMAKDWGGQEHTFFEGLLNSRCHSRNAEVKISMPSQNL